MKWQLRVPRLASMQSFGVGVGALLAMRLVACSADSGQQGGAVGGSGGVGIAGAVGGGAGGVSAGPICGNNLLEPGEACDGAVQVTCGMATMNAKPLGVVKCTACQLDASGCTSSGSGGANGAAGAVGTGASGGMVVGGAGTSGGGMSFGGVPGSGGTNSAGTNNGGTNNGGTSNGGTSNGGNGGTSAGGTNSVLGDIDALRQTCVDTINMYRATKMLMPLTLAPASVEACSDMGAQSDGTTMKAHGSAGKCPGMGAQDTCPGWNPKQYGGAAGALKACLMSMWGEGEPPEGRDKCLSDYFMGNITCFETYGHYLNMSDPGNTVVACGFFVMPSGGIWMNQDLGH
jgi:hypothetical protein